VQSSPRWVCLILKQVCEAGYACYPTHLHCEPCPDALDSVHDVD
jgi:hypothetical protein